MSIWGKIIGGAAGFALGGPLGALLGGIAGHAVDRTMTQDAPPDGSLTDAGRLATRHIAFTIGVIVLSAKMAKADGQVSRAEIDAFKAVFQIPAGEMRNVARVFDRARRDAEGFEPYARQIARLFDKSHPVLEELLDGLFHIARADGKVTAEEISYLAAVAQIFGFAEGEFARIREANVGAAHGDPYTILGIEHAASNETIKRAWRKLVRDNHPDHLTASGMPEEFVALANERLAIINAAYDTISRARNIT